MAKLNWEKSNVQNRSSRYGLEIDPRVGADPYKKPKYGKAVRTKRVVVAPIVKPAFVPQTILIKNSIIINSSSSKILELMKQLDAEIPLNSSDMINGSILELRSNVRILGKLSKSAATMKLIEDAIKLICRFPCLQEESKNKTKSCKTNKKVSRKKIKRKFFKY